MTQEQLEVLLENCLETGATFAEFYFETAESTKYVYKNERLDSIFEESREGVGIRILTEDTLLYAAVTKPTMERMKEAITSLLGATLRKKSNAKVKLKAKEVLYHLGDDIFTKSSLQKRDLLASVDQLARRKSKLISQVQTSFTERRKRVTIVNSHGCYREEDRPMLVFNCRVYAHDEGITTSDVFSWASSLGYCAFEKIDLEQEISKIVQVAVAKLNAIEGPAGKYPIILASGFGGTIFHEACGHPLEALRIADGTSVLADGLGKQIASCKVTLIDDGTIEGLHGTLRMDDEGMTPKKNILIEDGVLKKFLADRYYGEKIGQESTGSCRRSNYFYPPVPRMNNTYLAKGTDTIEEMLSSIDYGLYCFGISGGEVNTVTGDFCFNVSTSRIIRNGLLGEYVKNVTLIGNTKEILEKVEMVASDLALQPGFCNAESGWVEVTAGEPTIKVSSIMIGGKDE